MRFWPKHKKKLSRSPLISMVVASYLRDGEDVARRRCALECLLASFRAQTYGNWEAVIVHDGPDGDAVKKIVDHIADVRIHLACTPERKGQFGHPWRMWGVKQTKGEYVGMTNDDNYYAPVYFEASLALLLGGCDFTYVDMIHSHKLWKPFTTEPRAHRIDIGAWMASRKLALSVPWTDFSFSGDGTYIGQLAKRAKKAAKVQGHLFVHN